ncbi:MAG: peptidylprolyl isomerase [Patescibacteria group bacterium]
MNKVSLIICIAVVILFGAILYLSQANSSSQSAKQVPTLPPEANFFMATRSAQQQTQTQQQPQQQQQQVQGQQTQTDPNAPVFGVEEGVKASYSAVIKTSKGSITVTLFGDQAPRTVKNFIQKAEANFYKNLTFHRVEDWVLQGGDPKGNGTGGGMIQTELNQVPFTTGSLGVARSSDIRVSNDAQFFFTKTDAPWLNQQYTNFGMVTEGMDVVNAMKQGDKILGITVSE